jgi:methylenetetrahydrofolate dehydrogenase (NADP+) / methenyltetrahydrofolate cyclohydrolase
MQRPSQAKIIDGKAYAQELHAQTTKQVALLKKEHSIIPGLAVILVGDDPASKVYVHNKAKKTIDAGMHSYEHRLATSATEDMLLQKIEALNRDPKVNGILVQLPLPHHMREEKVINAIDPAKDVDGFHISNAGKLATGGNGTIPCTPKGCLILLKHTLGDLSGLKALVIGRSNIVGKPVAQLLLAENCTVTIAHSRTKDLAAECKAADIIISAVGIPHLVRGAWIKPGATLIDVGINRTTGADGKTKLVGDIHFDEAALVAGSITPVPGGVGPMTIACLLQNTLEATKKQHGITS